MTNTKQITIKGYFENDLVKEKFKEILGKKAQGFVTSVLSIALNNELLSKADPKSIYNAAMTAATLDLPINQNLGFAYIIPYNDRKTGQVVAQFQMGYKGFIQLAQRSGQFSTINVSDVREGEITGINRLTGEISYNWKNGDREKFPVVGYVAYMRLINGFEKSLYMTVEQLKNHGLQYSQTMKRGFGLWKDDFDAMASKTVIKLLLSKYAPLTTEMQTATLADQAIVEDEGYKYVDNEKLTPDEVAEEKERERIRLHIQEAKTLEELAICLEHIVDEETNELYLAREKELQKVGKK